MNTTLPIDTVIHGDALAVLSTFPDACIDAIIADPPCGISFMGRAWDDNKGSRQQWVSWLAEIMKQAMRVLKPGSHALIWSLPRQSHWTALALEDAGFTIRDNIYNIVSGDTTLHNFIASLNEEQQHAFMQIIDGQREPSGVLNIFGSGFPKSLNVSVAIDKLLGKEREIAGPRIRLGDKKAYPVNGKSMFFGEESELPSITTPTSEEAKRYGGWHSALKPSVENWWLVRKPLVASSIAENVLLCGTGALNIDATRIVHNEPSKTAERTAPRYSGTTMNNGIRGGIQSTIASAAPSGRFPSHLLMSHTPFCLQNGTKKVNVNDKAHTRHSNIGKMGYGSNTSTFDCKGYADEDGMETITAWECPEWCPVRILDLQSGTSSSRVNIKGKAGNAKFNGKYNNGEVYANANDQIGGYTDSGGASRYFAQFPALDGVPPYIYAGKASRKDRTANNTVQNTHPTVKNIELMKYMCRLLCPPNGIVLDCFAGSGSTGVACIHENFHYILIEREAEYIDIINARIAHALQTVDSQRSQRTQDKQSNQSQSIQEQHSTPSNHSPIIKDTTINKAPRRKQRKQQNTLQMALWNSEETA
jgi:DNA modification methylase